MNTTLTIVVAVLSSGALAALTSGLFTLRVKKMEREDNKEDLLDFIAAAMLTQLGKAAVKEGYIDFEEAQLFQSMFKLYKEKGGNGYVDLLNEKVKALPLKEKKDASD